jgi:hypothetical protein
LPLEKSVRVEEYDGMNDLMTEVTLERIDLVAYNVLQHELFIY